MRMISVQEGFRRLFERQAALPELLLHASGHCAHIGKLSPGCLKCFVSDGFYLNICPAYALDRPTRCQVDCDYCVDDWTARAPKPSLREETGPWELTENQRDQMGDHILANHQNAVIPTLSFSGGGEPTQHFSVVLDYLRLFESLESQLTQVPWYYLYTNGIDLTEDRVKECRDRGLDEIRFHLGASNFSRRVYRNMEVAARHLDTVSVETPAWPPHREKLFEMLPRIADIGVQHLNLGQVEIIPSNIDRITRALPEGEFYQVLAYQLDDGGLVYDLMREVIERRYSYSVLDCNGLVKLIQRGIDCGTIARQLLYDGTDLEGLADFEKWRRKMEGSTSNDTL